MSTQNNDTPSYQKQLFFCCVFTPIISALIAIFSTSLDAQTQSQIIAGLPAVLWLWFAITGFSCVLIMTTGYVVAQQLQK